MEAAQRSDNQDLAERLERIASLLAVQGANPFRVKAYERAADTIRASRESLVEIYLRDGIEGLDRLPGIGRSIASLIREYAGSGRISLQERLEGAVSAEEVLATVPGLGTTLAHRVHEALHVETLEELERACHDGRLAALPGFGPRRIAAVSASLAAMLGGGRRGRARATGQQPSTRPSVTAYLDVDEEYRRRASDRDLVRIAPRRFNPDRRAWLPILHTERDGWSFTALFSNSARAHQLHRTKDWVVIYADRDGLHDQCTVVTERRASGPLRVVRGRELECAETRGD